MQLEVNCAKDGLQDRAAAGKASWLRPVVRVTGEGKHQERSGSSAVGRVLFLPIS